MRRKNSLRRMPFPNGWRGSKERWFIFSFKREAREATGALEYLIVGLGNPGKKYEGTRHNAGFLAIDAIEECFGIPIKKMKFKAIVGEGAMGGKKVLLMKPQTFMNLSGEAVRAAADYYRLAPERIIVLCDDALLPVGTLRIREKGSDGGQNGLKSILYHLKRDTFPRVRIGVGLKPHPDYDLAAWVMSDFKKEERSDLEEVLRRAALAVEGIVKTDNVRDAMQRFNGSKPTHKTEP